MFLLYFLAVRSRKCLKNSLDVRSGVFGFVLSSFCFFVDVVFRVFVFEETQIR